MFTDIASFVIKNVSSKEYYAKRFPTWSGVKGETVNCPFHDDTNSHFSIDIGLNGGCYCHSGECNARVGSIVHMEKKSAHCKSDEEAARNIYAEFYHPILEVEGEFGNLVTSFRTNLISQCPDLIKLLETELGLDSCTLEMFNVGWDFDQHRFTFPIFNQWGHLINIRYYKAPSQRSEATKFKIVNHKGYGSPASLFPLDLIEKKPLHGKKLYWMKAERDVMLAWQLGIFAFCNTGGEDCDSKPFMSYLKRLGCQIVLCGDNDSAGEKAIAKKKETLKGAKIPFSCVTIPGTQKDFSDWIILESKTATDFLALPETEGIAPPIVLATSKAISLPKGFEDLTLTPLEGEYDVAAIGRRPELLNSAIKVKGVVAARVDRTYSIPIVYELNGKLFRLPICRELLQFVASSDKTIQKIMAGITNSKTPVTFRSYITVIEVEIIPVLVPGQDAVYVNQKCFYFGEKLECNLPYNLMVIPTSAINTQETVGLIYEAVPIANTLDSITLTDHDQEVLANRFSFPPETKGEELYIRLTDLALEIANKHTLVYNRIDLHILQMLTWCSPIQFDFHCDGKQRGWMNSLIVGDTETGKSKIANALRDLFASGAFISSENCSFVGLIGGAIKCASGMFMLRWGKIPLYNRQLVVIEELSGLTTEQIANMSDVRSSGVARLDKGGLSGETSAKTRLICISNVRRKHSSMSDFSSGVKAVQELIGQSEDISRFDLILSVTRNEVSNDIINRNRMSESNVLYDDEEKSLFRKLGKFIWSLKADQIEVTDAAYDAALRATMDMSKIYHPSVPIFNAGSGRFKIARIACAIACLQFSWDKQKGKIIVRESHIVAAVHFLKKCYNKPSLGYGKYSKQQYFLENIIGEDKVTKVIENIFPHETNRKNFLRYLSINGSFEKEEVSQSLNVVYIERLISCLQIANVIRRSPVSSRIAWEVTYAGRKWLEKLCVKYNIS